MITGAMFFKDMREMFFFAMFSHWEATKGETIHRMYRNCDYFGDGSVHDTWRPLTIQAI
jgi:hypothetical protein